MEVVKDQKMSFGKDMIFPLDSPKKKKTEKLVNGTCIICW
jgi:hypothetical protein